jgi:hypothetical protein
MKMKIIDERKESKNTFKALKIGEWFIDVDGNICLKVDDERGLYKNCVEEWSNECFDDSETVIPIEVEVHIVR